MSLSEPYSRRRGACQSPRGEAISNTRPRPREVGFNKADVGTILREDCAHPMHRACVLKPSRGLER
eukprot:5784943-Pyramimonas_sp.AAC.1